MAFPEFNSYSLQDLVTTGIITSNVKKYHAPERSLEFEPIARRPGSRILNDEYRNKTIRIDGYILANSPMDLRDKIDALHRNVSSVPEATFALSSDRVGTATLQRLDFSENPYNTDYVPFSMELLMTDPFFYDNQHSVEFTIASGEISHTEEITISGSYFASPSLTLQVDAGAGYTQTQRIDFAYVSTGETVVWSGGVSEENISYGDSLQIDYNTQLILRNSSTQKSSGSFAEWEPGERNFTVTFSGVGDWTGGLVTLSYQPRYL